MSTTLAHNGLPSGMTRFDLLRLFEQGGRVLSEFIERADTKSGPYSAAAEITEATNTLSDLTRHWFADPTALAEAQGSLARSYADLWNNAVRRSSFNIQGSGAVIAAVVSKRNLADHATSGRNSNWS